MENVKFQQVCQLVNPMMVINSALRVCCGLLSRNCANCIAIADVSAEQMSADNCVEQAGRRTNQQEHSGQQSVVAMKAPVILLTGKVPS